MYAITELSDCHCSNGYPIIDNGQILKLVNSIANHLNPLPKYHTYSSNKKHILLACHIIAYKATALQIASGT